MFIVVHGVAYSPKMDLSVSTVYNYKEIDANMLTSLIDLPVYIEHDTSFSIGKVIDATINDKCQVIVHLMIEMPDESTHQCMMHKLKTKYYQMLSLGHENEFMIKSKSLEVNRKEAVEVSIVREGARPGTFITLFEEVADEAVARSIGLNV